VDWFEAHTKLSGELVKLRVFAMRSMVSCDAFHRAYPRPTQAAFLEPSTGRSRCRNGICGPDPTSVHHSGSRFHHRRGDCCRDRMGHEPVSRCGSLGELGRAMSRQQRERG
jgi:hypothetical protein